MHDDARLSDHLELVTIRHKRILDNLGLSGLFTIAVIGPDGRVKDQETVPNLITQVGDQLYGERGAGVTGAPAVPTGMRLGTGSTAASKTGAGAAIDTYQSGSAKVLDAEPGSSLSGSSRRITYVVTWDGSESWSALREAVITNATIADAAGAEADTISRVVYASKSKDTEDTLVGTWTHDLLGA